jgi:myo-inositol-1(or 4)-monophosphatase
MPVFIRLIAILTIKADIMESNVNWLQVFFQCRENVIAHITPMLKKLKEPQPDLGKGAGGDPMKLIDLVAEKAIVEVLLMHALSFTLISEESGIKKFGEKCEYCYVTVDPIDGTTNLIRGLPFYCTSIAVSSIPTLSQIRAGMVSDLFHGTTFTATHGGGAYCAGQKILTSASLSLEQSVVGLDLNTVNFNRVASEVSDLVRSAGHIRHFGANALELCYVAQGLTEAFVDIRGKLRTTDVAAALLILKEAGGTISTPDGKSLDAKLDPKQTLNFVASGNAKIHGEILKSLRVK